MWICIRPRTDPCLGRIVVFSLIVFGSVSLAAETGQELELPTPLEHYESMLSNADVWVVFFHRVGGGFAKVGSGIWKGISYPFRAR